MYRFPFSFCIVVILICCLDTAAQRKSHFKLRKRSPDSNGGPEILTDIPQFPNQRLAQAGVMLGAMVGHPTTRLRLRKGIIIADANVAENIQTTLVVAPSDEPAALLEDSHLGSATTRSLNAVFVIETHIQAKSIFLHVFAGNNFLLPGRISGSNALSQEPRLQRRLNSVSV